MIKKVVLKPKTSFSELFTSDQIWGHMIWAISDMYGESMATEAVKAFRDNPPFIISSMMVNGYFPKPFYVDALGNMDSEEVKHNKKIKWIPYQDFRMLQNDCYAFSKKKLELKEGLIGGRNEVHVTIDRGTFKSIDGGLFNTSYLWTDKSLCFYLLSNEFSDEWKCRINEILEYWEQTGLGGDRNVGHGQFDIAYEELSNIEKEIFNYSDSSFFVSLSHCSGEDLAPVSYSVEVYAGILGRDNQGKYRKAPVIRYKPGSLFVAGNGCILEDTGFNGSCSFGLVFPVFVSYKE